MTSGAPSSIKTYAPELFSPKSGAVVSDPRIITATDSKAPMNLELETSASRQSTIKRPKSSAAVDSQPTADKLQLVETIHLKLDTNEDAIRASDASNVPKPQILARTKASMTTVGSRLKKPTQPGQATSFSK